MTSLYLLFCLQRLSHVYFFFFFNDTATTEIYTLSLHDALPISDEHEEDGRADIRLTVLHVGGDCAAQQPRDEEQPEGSSRRDQKEQRAQRLSGRDQHQLSLEAEPVQLRDDLRYLGELGAGAPDEREPAQKDQYVACRAMPFHESTTPSPCLVYNCHTSRPRLTMITGT